ncbi:MAG TPA: cobalamin-independent methionine synthase II family protein [Solirubrobacteraceae bacterium]|jgi:5-methyltetrahydropteroyltriglutamate--homocysteine methyltransferase|nr:cobalamin-independent methionine synthase II family protein [Solirubrobacteraceae bacterium]
MALPTEPVGSIPRPYELIAAIGAASGDGSEELERVYQNALRDTIEQFEATGSPVITDGEQTKPSFVTYPLVGLENLAADGIVIPFEDGHTRELPRLVSGPFRYAKYADAYLTKALAIAKVPVKQAVIAPSAISLIYPQEPIDGYSREQFIEDLVNEAEADVRRSLEAGAYKVQLDFTEGRLSVKLDPSKGVLRQFIELNNSVLERFSADDRERIGVHTCPGGDHNSTHSLDVPYQELLPSLLELKAGNFYIQLASEKDPRSVLEVIRENAKPGQRIFIGVIDPIDPRVETADEVRDRVLQAAEYIPVDRLGSTDDCGFAPFGDDTATPRDVAFAKIRARVEGTQMASDQLGV